MKYRYFVYCLLLLPILGRGQGFELFYGDTTSDVSIGAIKTIQVPNEDAYLTVNIKHETQTGESGFIITKVDNLGNILWEKQYDPPAGSLFDYKYAELPNGFLLACSVVDGFEFQVTFETFNFEGDLISDASYALTTFDYLYNTVLLPDHSVVCIIEAGIDNGTILTKISQDGNLIWTKNLPDTLIYASECYAFESTPAGELLVLGKVATPFLINVVTKFDQMGNLLWQTHLPLDLFKASIMTFPAGDGYFIYGEEDGSTGPHTYIAKVSNDGVLIWHQDFSSHLNNVETGAILGEGNTIYMTGTVNDDNLIKTALIHIDTDGNVLWEKRYYEFQNNAGQLLRDSDGGFFIASTAYPSPVQGFSTDPYFFKTDANGELLWSWYTTHQGYYVLTDAIQTSDGGHLVIGYSEGISNNDRQNYLIKIDSNGVVYTNFIAGQLVYDENKSCSYDNGELSLADWKIKGTTYQSTYATTFADGSFWLPTNGNSVVVTALPPNNCWTTCADPVYALFSMPFDTVNVELKAQATKDCPLLEVDVSTSFLRRCLQSTYHLQCKNTGTVPAENVQLTVLLDSFFIFQNASLPVAAQNGNELIFNIGSLGVNESISFTTQVEVSCNAEIGQVHCLSLTAHADNECTNTSRELSSTTECQPNTGSYDPNDKRAFSQGALTDRFIPADSIIEYQIRFQNTGTDTAFNITITDTLSSLLDIESIIAGASSHPYQMELERNNILKFVFKDILLPDSNVNEAASHGFVKFRIRHRPGLVPGDVIPNKAAIYFDFNEAVITNNLELEIKSPTSAVHPSRLQADLLCIFPQPASDALYFELKNIGQQFYRLEVFNLLGQLIHEQPLKGGVNAVVHLPAGQHFYRLRQNGAVVQAGRVLVIRP